ncbi:MAG: hypothetical protein V2A79_11695 [Planctomycetota bacterium]
MGSTATLTGYGAAVGCGGVDRGGGHGLLRALARGLGRAFRRAESRRPERPTPQAAGSAVEIGLVNATGDLRETRVLQGFQRRCEAALNPGRPRVVVDLGRVVTADTKLVATLIMLLQRARSVGVPLELTVSSRVYDWITLCRVEWLLHARCVQGGRDGQRACGEASRVTGAEENGQGRRMACCA